MIRESQAKHYASAVKETKRIAAGRYEDLIGGRKTPDLVKLRWHIARYLRDLRYTIEQIGAALNRSHTTVCYMLADDDYRTVKKTRALMHSEKKRERMRPKVRHRIYYIEQDGSERTLEMQGDDEGVLRIKIIAEMRARNALCSYSEEI